MPGGYQAKPASKGGALKAVGDTALGAGMMEGGRKVVERMAGIKPLQFIKNNPGKVLGGGGLLTVLAAASELGDDDPVKQNLLQGCF